MERRAFSMALVVVWTLFAAVAALGLGCAPESSSMGSMDSPGADAGAVVGALRQRFPDHAGKVLEQEEGFAAMEGGVARTRPAEAG